MAVNSLAKQKWTTIELRMQERFNLGASTPFIDRRGIITFAHPDKGICEFDEAFVRIVVAQKYANGTMYLNPSTFCYHAPSDQIFIFDHRQNLFIYNASTKQWKTRKLNVEIDPGACCVCLGDSARARDLLLVYGYIRQEHTLPEDITSIVVECFSNRARIHIFGDKNKHDLLYDIETEELAKSGVELMPDYRNASIVADASRNTIYLIDGEYGFRVSSTMYEIAVNNNGSKIKNIHEMPDTLGGVGCVFYDPYIFMFGGISGYSCKNDIYSFHIHTHEWKRLPMQTPFKNVCHAILARDRKRVHLFERGNATSMHSIALCDLLPQCAGGRLNCFIETKKIRRKSKC